MCETGSNNHTHTQGFSEAAGCGGLQAPLKSQFAVENNSFQQWKRLQYINALSFFSFLFLCDAICTHSQRKQQKDLLAALQKVVVPIYCTSFLAVEEEKQQKITRVNNIPMQAFLKSPCFCSAQSCHQLLEEARCHSTDCPHSSRLSRECSFFPVVAAVGEK